MRKKDYLAVGQAVYSTWFNLRDRNEELTDRQLFTLIDMLLINLSKTSPKFDKALFVSGCLTAPQLDRYLKFER